MRKRNLSLVPELRNLKLALEAGRLVLEGLYYQSFQHPDDFREAAPAAVAVLELSLTRLTNLLAVISGEVDPGDLIEPRNESHDLEGDQKNEDVLFRRWTRKQRKVHLRRILRMVKNSRGNEHNNG
jgi:hypothetical protein